MNNMISTERETEKTTSTETRSTCPECEGRLVHETTHGEMVCDECGLVVETVSLDYGPEWRAYTSREEDAKSRVGPPRTNTRHDHGLTTSIDWQNKDATGKALSARKREQINRLRTWNERYRTQDAKDRNLKHALGEIDRMASALGLPKMVRETASVIYRRALREDLLVGRSIEGVATAALHAAARQHTTPRPITAVAGVSRVDELRIRRTYRYLVRELALKIAPPDPERYVPQLITDLNVDNETEQKVYSVLETAKDAELHSGRNPVALAAAAIYAAAQLTDEPLTQSEVAAVADTSRVTIRHRYRELLNEYDSQ